MLCFRGCMKNHVNKIHVRHIQWASSYIHSPGAEPLQYRTCSDMIASSADAWPGRPAITSVHQQTTITYSQLLTQADALGYALSEAGVARGDRIGIFAHNCTEWVVAIAAAFRANFIPVAMNPAYEQSELSFCLKKVGMRAIVIGEDLPIRSYSGILDGLVPEIRKSKAGELHSREFPDLKVVVSLAQDKIHGMFRYKDLVSDHSSVASRPAVEIQPEDGAIIHLTSGTTGDPKAAIVSNFSMLNNGHYIGKGTTLHHGHEKICVQVPLFHAFGTVVTTMAGLQHGATLVLPSALYSPKANLHTMVAEKCTVAHGTPVMYTDALTLHRNGGFERPNLRVALIAGAPCSPQLIRDVKTHFRVHTVKSLFGLTETTAGVFQSRDGESEDKVTDTVGHVMDHLEVKVVDDAGRAVEFGKPGELLVRGYNVMQRYWDDPEKTRQVISPDGWLSTGDLLTLGSDGYGTIVGRIKDLIIRGGENIAPKEIEDVLNTHPDIIDSQVFGASDERLGEEICVALRTRDGVRLSVEDLTRHCAGRLAKYKLPRLVRHVDSFPKTASGKVQKHKLKIMMEMGEI